MQVQYVWLMLAPPYDETCIPSTISQYGHCDDPRKAAKAIRHFISKRNLNSYQRRTRETVNEWVIRLEKDFGNFVDHISPPKKVLAPNNRHYTGHSAIVLMFLIPDITIRRALSLALLISCLKPSQYYSPETILAEWPITPENDPELLNHLEECIDTLKGTSTEHEAQDGFFLGKDWLKLIPPETLIKAKDWFYDNQATPEFFQKPPEWLRGHLPVTTEAGSPPKRYPSALIFSIGTALVIGFGAVSMKTKALRISSDSGTKSKETIPFISDEGASYPLSELTRGSSIEEKLTFRFFEEFLPPGTY